MATNENENMTPPDLGLLFSTNARDVTASKIFVNRDHECLAFDDAVHFHHEYVLAGDFDAQNVLAPRRNVQVFYGSGGVGKSALSRALESRHNGEDGAVATGWPIMQWEFERSVTARIDLASEAGMDMERILLLIRTAVAKIGHPVHAFDIALSRYWEQAHPDKSLAEFLRSDSVLGRAGEALKIPDQIRESLKEISTSLGNSSTVISVASQLAAILVQGTRKRRAKRHAIQECQRLPALLEAEADVESLSYYPHLLSWDLSQLSKRLKKSFHVTVFMDTFEDVSQEANRNFEQLLQRLIWLMPNVLFVISGRNRLDWAEVTSAGKVGWSGPVSWPTLVMGSATEPTQHLVGYLSQDDCATFLSMRLRSGGQPLIPGPLRTRIAQESAGYPLYLDMAVARYLQIIGSGMTPEPTDFAGGFPGLISRVLRDLESEERRLLRILSLLDSFDTELAVKVADLRSESIAFRLIQRAFVEFDEEAAFPYSIHRQIRQEMQQAVDSPDAFTTADWSRYAQRAFDELGERYHLASRTSDRITANSALNQALRLADEYHLDLDWCVDAAYLFIEDSLWEGSVRPLVGSALASPAAALAQTLLAIVSQRTENRRGNSETLGDMMLSDLRETARVLNEVLTTDLLSGEAKDMATYYAAEALRELGSGAEAERLIRSITGRNSRMAGLAAKGLVHRLRRMGRFRELRELIEEQPREAVWLQMAGTLSWSQGLLAQAKQEYQASRGLFLEAGYLGNADELLGSLAFVCGLSGDDGTDNVELVAEGIATMSTSRNVWARLMAQLGASMLEADGREETASRILAISEEGKAAGLTSIQSYAHLSLCLNAALSDDPRALQQARHDLESYVTVEDFYWLLEIADFWSDQSEPEGIRPIGADWFDSVEDTRARWRQVLLIRRDDL
jgi:acyl carrier protein phosphodiesterase